MTTSCLCCGHIGAPKVSLIDRPEVYVCERCHRRATLPMPENGFATEEEGDAYTHGWFDGNEAPRTSGVMVVPAPECAHAPCAMPRTCALEGGCVAARCASATGVPLPEAPGDGTSNGGQHG